jgi:sugar lactone lactonase YvrE
MIRSSGWTWMAVAACLWATAACGEAKDEGATLNDAALLKGPDRAAGVDVAKTPPSVYVRIFKDLPPAGKGGLWSNWGEACLASNGKYYCTMGDHLDIYGGTGQSRVYEFEPATKALRMVLNMRDVIPDTKLAGGKVHARIEEAADGWLYFSTYWGKIPKQADWDAGFLGSALLRCDPRTGKAECLGVPVPQQGLPTSLMDPKRGLIYFLAVYSDDLVVYDLAKREVTYRGSGDIQSGSRNIMKDVDGNIYFSTTDGGLARYSPATNQVTMTKAKLPVSAHDSADAGDAEGAGAGEKAGAGPAAKPDAKAAARPGAKARSKSAGKADGKTAEQAARSAKRGGGATLRASARPAADGTIYGMTHAGILFKFDPKAETVTALGPNFLDGFYCANMMLSPDGKYVYFAPGSHGSGVPVGAPVVQYDVATGKRKVLAFLGPVMRERCKYTMGGSFNLRITADGGTLLATFNGSPYDSAARKEVPFGQPCLVMLEIPKSER